jgi:hypothetical protein
MMLLMPEIDIGTKSDGMNISIDRGERGGVSVFVSVSYG